MKLLGLLVFCCLIALPSTAFQSLGRSTGSWPSSPASSQSPSVLQGPSDSLLRSQDLSELVVDQDRTGNENFANEQELDYLEWLVRKHRKKGQTESAADVLRDIEKRQEYDVRAISRLNEVFYQAFTKQDSKVMGELWLRESDISCIHPGVAEVVVGYDRVMRVWKDILAPKRSWIQITPENTQITVRGNTAFAYCFERVVPESTGAPMEQRLFATNVFIRRHGIWFIVHHHATLLKAPAPEKSGREQQQQQQIMQLQGLTGLNGAKFIGLGSLKGGQTNLGGASGGLDDLASQLGSIERQAGGESKKPRIRMLKDGKYQILSSEESDEEEEEETESSVQRDKGLTRKTVRAIQQLFTDGRIGIEQKRRLLNEIIQHANDDVPSMVEIAYELLLRNDDEEEDATSPSRTLPAKAKAAQPFREEDILEEFAEQCKIITEGLDE